jgi:tetratricopeptide (TPR) repeat protein
MRVISDPARALLSGDDLAVGKGELALNNVGLALEAFRKAQRADPSDPAPLAGIADCYIAMGRYDLAQTNFEAALALAPRNNDLLSGLAKVLDLEGQPERASKLRREAQRDSSGTAAPPSVASPPLDNKSTVTVALPVSIAAGAPPTAGSSVTVALPPPKADQTQPWLERLSPGEVALVTTRQRQPQRSTRPAVTAALHWAPLSQPTSASSVQVLNAARASGLAASARAMLADRGWHNVVIGSASTVRQSSVVVYPREQARLARRLAAQLGIRSRMIGGHSVVVLLGRDKAGTLRPQRRA